MQVAVLKNLASKLRKNVNHRFSELLKEIALVHKTQHGETNYSRLSSIVSFPSQSTLYNFEKHNSLKFNPGINSASFVQASLEYEGHLLYECSDEARIKRTIEATETSSGSVELLGECWEAKPKSNM